MRVTSTGLLLALTAAAATAGSTAAQSGWLANPRIVEQHSAKKTADSANYDEARVAAYELPALIRSTRGTPVTAKAWSSRRAEILELFREHVYGRSPGRPQRLQFEELQRDDKAMDGTATLQRIAILSNQSGRDHRFEMVLFLPKAPSGPVPVFLLLNNRPATNTDPTRRERSGFWPAEQVIARGYGIAAIQVGDLAPDDKARFREGVIRLFEGTTESPRPVNGWAALAAWAWGASRAMDYLATNPRVDASHVAVVGHSRGGKAALWAGAEDERFAMVVANESGEGGAALSRRNYGETLARITATFPHWFAPRYASYAGKETSLPVDQHMLLALSAPRALYVASADEDLWSDPRGEFLSLAHSSPVFALWGDSPIALDAMPPLQRPLVTGRRGYHVRTGTHNLTPYDWDCFLGFADTVWK